MSTESKKVDIIKVSSTGPLAFFALVVTVAVAALIATANQIEEPATKQFLVIGIVLLLILMVTFAGLSLLKKGNSSVYYPSHGALIGEPAIKSFFEGGDAAKLAGRWEVDWKVYDDEGNEISYQVHENGNMDKIIEYPKEIASIQAHGALVSVENFDPTTKYTYFFEGRLSEKDIVTLIYWSKNFELEKYLVGSVILQYEASVRGISMSGDWIGYDRSNKVTSGKVYWNKLDK